MLLLWWWAKKLATWRCTLGGTCQVDLITVIFLQYYPNHDISALGGFPSVYSCDSSRGTSSLQNALPSDLQKRFVTPLTENIYICHYSQSWRTKKGILNYFSCQVAAGGSGGRQVTEEEVRRVMSQAIVRQVGSRKIAPSTYVRSIYHSPPALIISKRANWETNTINWYDWLI